MPNEIVIPTPHKIAANLETLEGMIEDEGFGEDRQQVILARKMLRAAQANIRLLFELKADPETGEFRLENYGQAWMLADLLKAGDMVPRGYETTEQVVIGLMKATEIGVSAISGLGNIMILNNRPSVWGDLAQALVQRTGKIARFEQEEIGTKPEPGMELPLWPNDYGWKVSIWRKGQDAPYVGEYTVADARRATLWGDTRRKPWISDPSRMLFNRARARPIRDGFSDCLFGMGIIEEQVDFVDPSAASHPALAAPKTSSALDDEPVTETVEEGGEVRDYGDVTAPEEPETSEDQKGEPPTDGKML